MAAFARILRAQTEPQNEENAINYTYSDAIHGRVHVPDTGAPGKLIFTLMMVISMVTVMCTFNGTRHYGSFIGFITHAHWLYPLIFVVAFTVRLSIADAIAGKIIPAYITPNFTGVRKTILITLTNVSIMCPIMSALATLLLNGTDDFFWNYLTSLACAYPFGILMNFFVVGPLVKIGFNKMLYSERGIHFFNWFKANVMPVLLFFNS